MVAVPDAMAAEAGAIIDGVRRRLAALAADRPYRFLGTARRDAEAYQSRKTAFLGWDAETVSAAERALRVDFPAVFRAYLLGLGRSGGDLFRGSDIAGPKDLARFRADAQALMHESGVRERLPANAVAFLFHQGYSFAFFVAQGGFDSPVFAFVEGSRGCRPSADGFAAYLDGEVRAAEEAHRSFHRQGGYYVSIRDGMIKETFPARSKGDRPLDHADMFTD